jgi:hypothetical protein
MERKQLLGAVFDEIEHHFKLYQRERNVYLGLAAVAALSLVGSVLVLWLKPGEHSAAAVALGAAGLVAFAAARSTAFFHSVSKLVEEVVKRYSKISEPEIVSSVETMRKRSETSLVLFACAAAAVIVSVAYAIVRTQQMERVVAAANEQVARKDVDLAQLQKRFDAAEQGHVALKNNVSAYGAYVLRENQVMDIRASLEPVKKKTPPPEYVFSLLLNSSPEMLGRLSRVAYTANVPDAEGLKWEELKFESTDPASGFRVSFNGHRCSALVDVALEFADGATEAVAFNQCRALRMPEPPHPAAPPPSQSRNGATSNDAVDEAAPAPAAARKCDPTEQRLAEMDRAMQQLESGESQAAAGGSASAQKECTPG